MNNISLVTIYSALHVLAQGFALFAKSKQNGLSKTNFTVKWDQFRVLLTTRSDLHVLAQCCARFILFTRSKQNDLNNNTAHRHIVVGSFRFRQITRGEYNFKPQVCELLVKLFACYYRFPNEKPRTVMCTADCVLKY